MQSKRKSGQRKPSPQASFLTTRVVAALLVVLALIVYANTIPGRFVFDDTVIVQGNPSIQGLGGRHLGEIFGGHYWRSVESRGGLYRPVVILTYALNYAWGGEDPAGYHVVNMALHAANAVLVWILLESLFARPALSFLSALLFALHPIRTEAVASVVGRAEVLSTFFMLLAWIGYVRARKSERWALLVFAAGFFALALLTKESAFSFPALLLVTDLFLGPGEYRRKFAPPGLLSRYAPFALVALLVLGLRYKVLGGLTPLYINPASNPLATVGAWPRFLTATHVFARYIGLLLFPMNLSADYSFNEIPVVSTLLSWRGALPLGLLASICAGTVIAFRRQPFLFFSSMIFFTSFALTSNWARPIGTIMAERLMYFPSLGFNCGVAWLISSGLERVQWRRAAASAAVVLALGYGLRTMARNLDWRDHYALFGSAVRTSPGSALVQANYAAVLLRDKRDPRGAAEHARIASRIMADDPSAWFTLGAASKALGELQESADAFSRAASLAPKTSGGVSALKQAAEIRAGLGQLARARADYELLRQWRPSDQSVRTALGRVCLRMGDAECASAMLGPGAEVDSGVRPVK
jgi:protein O-mannosyl-transferase